MGLSGAVKLLGLGLLMRKLLRQVAPDFDPRTDMAILRQGPLRASAVFHSVWNLSDDWRE